MGTIRDIYKTGRPRACLQTKGFDLVVSVSKQGVPFQRWVASCTLETPSKTKRGSNRGVSQKKKRRLQPIWVCLTLQKKVGSSSFPFQSQEKGEVSQKSTGTSPPPKKKKSEPSSWPFSLPFPPKPREARVGARHEQRLHQLLRVVGQRERQRPAAHVVLATAATASARQRSSRGWKKGTPATFLLAIVVSVVLFLLRRVPPRLS